MEKQFEPSLVEQNRVAAKAAEDNMKDREWNRYRQDCRKRALDVGYETAIKQVSNAPSEMVIKEADKYYEWLTKVNLHS